MTTLKRLYVTDSELDHLISGTIAVKNSINFDLVLADTDNEIATLQETRENINKLKAKLEKARFGNDRS